MYAQTEKNIACNWTVSLGQRCIILVKPVSQRAWECPLSIPPSFLSVSGEKHTNTFSCVPHFQVDQEEVSTSWQDFILYCRKSPCAGISMNFQWCWCYHDLWIEVFCLTQYQHPRVHIKSSVWVKNECICPCLQQQKHQKMMKNLSTHQYRTVHMENCIHFTNSSAIRDFFQKSIKKHCCQRGITHANNLTGQHKSTFQMTVCWAAPDNISPFLKSNTISPWRLILNAHGCQLLNSCCFCFATSPVLF